MLFDAVWKNCVHLFTEAYSWKQSSLWVRLSIRLQQPSEYILMMIHISCYLQYQYAKCTTNFSQIAKVISRDVNFREFYLLQALHRRCLPAGMLLMLWALGSEGDEGRHTRDVQGVTCCRDGGKIQVWSAGVKTSMNDWQNKNAFFPRVDSAYYKACGALSCCFVCSLEPSVTGI